MKTRFLVTRQGKDWRVDREGDFLTITNMKTGEPHKSPRSLITNNGGVEGLWANCKTQEELDAMRAYLNSPEHKAQLAKEKAEREAYKARIEQKISTGSTDIPDSIRSGHIAYVINTSDLSSSDEKKDGHEIRTLATDNNVTIFTNLDTVRVLLDVLEETTLTISTIDA